ncbi:uncharacterized protein EI90DRAFT_1880233 [Cantharellus anzutake]|uniref:uncharacterized protein n=1 Tax=Cantharellus anzutake TaxID=1750568 RepID=UPI001903F45A|nr:uncharacterized protein EI90DRAFT_1880233 [Cantharellus anzutake]KAF8326854.1 hypothetical protein EI90DRAFT_1880233 [Cantharellus anzutake]
MPSKDSLVEIVKSKLHEPQDLPRYLGSPDSGVPDTLLDSLALRFEDIANNHSMSSKTELLKLVPEELRLPSAQETLELARTLFLRLLDSSIVRYPRLADHGDWCWNKHGSTVMSDIIILAGCDPNAMTFAQLLDKGIWVECLTCAQAGQGGKIFEAVEAVMHCNTDHCADIANKRLMEWRILDGQELASFRTLNPMINKWWGCLLCGYERIGFEDFILQHVASEHPSARPDLQYCYVGSHRQTPRRPIPDLVRPGLGGYGLAPGTFSLKTACLSLPLGGQP